MNQVIKIENLTKKFNLREVFPGILGAAKGLFFAKQHEITVINQLSFDIRAGERVAFIGPNGAGKSTTIKMLTGILYPTSGAIKVLGLTPWTNRHILGYQIGTVFGQKTQLWYHLPPTDTFLLLSKIYELDFSIYSDRLRNLIDLFEISELLNKPVFQLSLGERMRCEIVASLLHNPKILFLDEPTIGLDINAKLMIRELLNRLSKDFGTTLFLTSHDTADIEQVCDRVIVLDKGSIIADHPLKELKKTYGNKKIITMATEIKSLTLNLPGTRVLETAPHYFRCEADLEITSINQIIQTTLQLTNLNDLTIEDLSMDAVIRLIYRKKSNA